MSMGKHPCFAYFFVSAKNAKPVARYYTSLSTSPHPKILNRNRNILNYRGILPEF